MEEFLNKPPEKYHSLDELLGFIEEPNQSRCRKLYEDYREIIDTSKGSKVKHQAWEGGYKQHLEEAGHFAVLDYWVESNYFRELPFSLSDAILTLFFHDLEKPWKYSGDSRYLEEFNQFDNYQDFIFIKAKEYGVEFSEEHVNAIKYVHGEGDDYDPKRNVMGPLAAFIHCCDIKSARIWPNYPK